MAESVTRDAREVINVKLFGDGELRINVQVTKLVVTIITLTFGIQKEAIVQKCECG